MFNDEITIFNYFLDETARYKKLSGTVISDANIFSSTNSQISDGQTKINGKTILRIKEEPCTVKKYINSIDFQNADKTKYYTLQVGDIVLLEKSSQELINDWDELQKMYGLNKIFAVTKITNNLRGGTPHWKLEAM